MGYDLYPPYFSINLIQGHLKESLLVCPQLPRVKTPMLTAINVFLFPKKHRAGYKMSPEIRQHNQMEQEFFNITFPKGHLLLYNGIAMLFVISHPFIIQSHNILVIFISHCVKIPKLVFK
ncbi:hypothetical protein SAMN04488072_106226 [Lentibacillus halodurans]|uniref:Uncharacterized protein n=1 Tax=Lentibacillus halodurans TaxID=237679 RepID=A0A1I0Y3P3_9BACI|nr:hypothetical protein SAMN04488072_106226 [Lentibacillus halodurans]